MNLMSTAKSVIVRLSDLKKGERGTFFVQLADKAKGATHKGNPFFACKFRDLRRTATYMVWGDGPHYATCATDWQPGQFFKMHAAFNEHEKYGGQLEVLKIRPTEDRDAVDGFDPKELVEQARREPDEVLKDLRAFIEATIGDEPLKKLTLGILEVHAEKLKPLPASDRRFYPYPGGWLEHVESVSRNAVWLAQQYRDRFLKLKPPINVDLVASGAVLHDIGRVLEFAPSTTLLEPVEYSIDGRLFGHLFLGRDLVRDAAKAQGDVNPELLRLLEHIIITHLRHPEWGSPKLPMIPEVLILHHADDLDAKMEMYTRCLIRDASDGPFTERDPMLGQTLLKRREV
ncbi:MAG: HD domain-containing protein [Gemmataceae bacterium]|nr:HD domain-containing protein [Gemmataceae bacterium]